jgi:hypothetical protein
MVSEVGVGVDEVAWSEVRCSVGLVARRRLHVPASRCLSEEMVQSGDTVMVRGARTDWPLGRKRDANPQDAPQCSEADVERDDEVIRGWEGVR